MTSHQHSESQNVHPTTTSRSAAAHEAPLIKPRVPRWVVKDFKENVPMDDIDFFTINQKVLVRNAETTFGRWLPALMVGPIEYCNGTAASIKRDYIVKVLGAYGLPIEAKFSAERGEIRPMPLERDFINEPQSEVEKVDMASHDFVYRDFIWAQISLDKALDNNKSSRSSATCRAWMPAMYIRVALESYEQEHPGIHDVLILAGEHEGKKGKISSLGIRHYYSR